MGNSVNELIEQIGGRERLKLLSETGFRPRHDDVKAMARALLAVLGAKPVGTVSIVPDWNSIPRGNIATVNMRPDLVMSEMRDGDNLYTTPPAVLRTKYADELTVRADLIEAYSKTQCEIAQEIGCDSDNESILKAIYGLKKLVAQPPKPVTIPGRYDIAEMSGDPWQSYRCIEPDDDGEYVRLDEMLSALNDAGVPHAGGK